MFHWICPECGREIAPTVRECPVCDPVAATVETALAGEVEAPARAEREVAAPIEVSTPVAEIEAELDPYQPVAAAVAPVVASTTSAPPIHPEATALEAPPPVDPPVDAAPPALAARVESVSPLAARGSPSAVRQDAGDRADALLPRFGAPSEGGDPLEHLSSMLVSS